MALHAGQYKPGEAFSLAADPLVAAATGALTNADSLPAATLYRNKAADGTVTVTVTPRSAGLYWLDATIPAGYSAGDHVLVEMAGSVGGVPFVDQVLQVRLVQWPVTALPNAASEAAGGVITRGAGAGQLNVAGGKAPATLAAADVSGNLPAAVNSVVANAIDAAAIAANAITPAECPALANLDASVSSRAAVGSAMSLADGAVTDAKFGFTADPSAAPGGIVSGLWWLLCRSGLRKFIYNRLTGKGQVLRADGVTVWTENTITATGTAETSGALTVP